MYLKERPDAALLEKVLRKPKVHEAVVLIWLAKFNLVEMVRVVFKHMQKTGALMNRIMDHAVEVSTESSYELVDFLLD